MTTRKTAGGILMLMALTALPSPAQSRFPALLDAKFQTAVRDAEAGLDGVLGLALKDLKTGKAFLINEREVFPQASSIKIAILFEAFKQAEEGRLQLDEFIALEESRKVAGSGVLYYLGRPSLRLSVHDTAVLMIVLSDNTATNLLIDRVGMDAVNKRMDAMGLPKTRLRRKMMDLTAAGEGRENVSTPLEMMTLLERLWKGDILKEPYRKDFLEILAIPKESPLRSGVPEGIDVAEKPGELEAVRCDSGIVMLPGRPYILCVMTTYLKRDTDGNPVIAKISRLAFEHFSRLERSSEIGRVVSDK
ncbi:MAG: class A beta-lactamase-related serine hydrolase [Candidatus Aminicenantes bacterium]|nr:class A beta-lactamase-related serine hydrolase [Candidatus Aminicenantes bacterium]